MQQLESRHLKAGDIPALLPLQNDGEPQAEVDFLSIGFTTPSIDGAVQDQPQVNDSTEPAPGSDDSGNAALSDVVVTRLMDAASPQLFKDLSPGSPDPDSFVIDPFDPSQDREPYLQIEFQLAPFNGLADDSGESDSVDLNYDTIQFRYSKGSDGNETSK